MEASGRHHMLSLITSHECEGAFGTPCPGAQNMEKINIELKLGQHETNLESKTNIELELELTQYLS